MGIKTWEWEKLLHTVTSKHLQKALIEFKFSSHAIIVQHYYWVIFLWKLTFIFWVLSIYLIATCFL